MFCFLKLWSTGRLLTTPIFRLVRACPKDTPKVSVVLCLWKNLIALCSSGVTGWKHYAKQRVPKGNMEAIHPTILGAPWHDMIWLMAMAGEGGGSKEWVGGRRSSKRVGKFSSLVTTHVNPSPSPLTLPPKLHFLLSVLYWTGVYCTGESRSPEDVARKPWFDEGLSLPHTVVVKKWGLGAGGTTPSLCLPCSSFQCGKSQDGGAAREGRKAGSGQQCIGRFEKAWRRMMVMKRGGVVRRGRLS